MKLSKIINKLFMFSVIIILTCIGSNVSVKADAEKPDFAHTDFGTVTGLSTQNQMPYVEYAGVDHYPVISGDKIKIDMISKYNGDYSDYSNYDPVQYRVFISKNEDSGYVELTQGYSNAIPAPNQYILENNNALNEGNYKVMVFVKKATSDGINSNDYGVYDNIYNFSFTCFNSNNAPTEENSVMFNTSGNVVNDGMAVEDDNYIYYINRAGDIYGTSPDLLYKIKKKDISRKDLCDLNYNTQVIDNRVWNLNLVGDWIYYSNWKDAFHHSINKVKKDGTQNTCIANEAAGNMFVNGNWIYYVKRTNSHSIDLNNIYKISVDGSCRIKLNDSPVEDMTMSEGWIYYTNIKDGYKIYRMKSDGSENTKVCDDETLFMTVFGNNIFYSNKSDGENLYKINTDGTKKCKISDNKATFINANKDYVYFVNASDKDNLYKTTFSGGKAEKITDEYGFNITILDNKIYFNGMFYDK